MHDIIERLAEASEQLLAPGASHEIHQIEVNGVPLKAYINAPANLRDALDAGRAHGERDFIVYEGERWSFDRYFREVDRFAEQLVSRYGLGKGDRVAIAMRNYPEWMAAFTAIISMGGVAVPLNSWGQAEELVYGLTDAGAKLVVCDQQRFDYIAGRLPELGIEAVLVRGEQDAPAGVALWTELQAAETDPEPRREPLEPDDHVMIMYTSGTTGRPKGAVYTHRAICQALHNFDFHAYCSAMANPDIIGKMMASGFEPSTLLVVPLFHVSGCLAVFMLNLRGGRKTVLMYKWHPETALRLIEEERITAFTGVPAMSLALLESPEFDRADTASLFTVGIGGAATPAHLRELVYRKLPDCYPGTGYGMTESGASGASCTGEAFRVIPGTSGSISPIVEVKTVDENGRDLPHGETGEIHLRSPTNVTGYWNLPEASAETFADGWLATGDVGYVDENNFLFVVDRIKDMVIRGGENIYPVEVESCILEHPDVIEVTAFGVPHDSLGEELVAAVNGSADLSEEAVRAWVGERLAGFKVPSRVVISDRELPKNATGKVLKKQVRQAYLDSL